MKIKIDKIDHDKEDLSEALGVSQKEISDCEKEIAGAFSTVGELAERVGIDIEEILKEFRDPSNNGKKITWITAKILKKKGIEEITLKEFLKNLIVLRETYLTAIKKKEDPRDNMMYV